MISNPDIAYHQPLALSFPTESEQCDTQRRLAEYAILGGMLKADERYLHSGANVDWSHPMNEAISRACVEAWEQHGADTDEGWRCSVSASLMRYTGRSPILDIAMRRWVFYMMQMYDWQQSIFQDARDTQEAR
jgi:hypothetical protein